MPKYTPKGLPDVMLLNEGKFYAIEFKRPYAENDEREPNGRKVRAGMLSPHQAEWAAKCALAGGHYWTIRSLAELNREIDPLL